MLKVKRYPGERLPIFQVSTKEELGLYAALHFLKWVSSHPPGLIALATGRTPRSFWKALHTFKQNPKQLIEHQLPENIWAKVQQLSLVQLDEYVSLSPSDPRSFREEILCTHLPCLSIPKERCLLISSDQWKASPQSYAKEYEEQIRQRGDIQYFLGGLGPDGHVAFNFPGSPFRSLSREVLFNKSSAAYAARTFGGIDEASKQKLFTVGLHTLRRAKSCHHLFLVDSRIKQEALAKATLCAPSPRAPLSAWQSCKHTTILATDTACQKLPHRKKEAKTSPQQILQALRPLTTKKILHTAPHHDDLFLAYFPWIKQLASQKTSQTILYFMPGYRGVTDKYCEKVRQQLPASSQNELKTSIREREACQAWKHGSKRPPSLIHLRASCYEQTTPKALAEDKNKFKNALLKHRPDSLSFALDPQVDAPTSHWQCLEIVYHTLKELPAPLPTLLAYRNVWSQMPIEKADLILCFSGAQLRKMQTFFPQVFPSQEPALFPSPLAPDSFGHLAVHHLKEQYQQVCDFIGKEKLPKTTRGCAFIWRPTLSDLHAYLQRGDF